MAMRASTVGKDTQFYSYSFTQFPDIPWSKLFTTRIYATESANWFFDFEPGYRIYNKLLSYLSSSRQMITVCNSVFIIVLIYQFIKKNSPNYMLSIWLYITLGIFQTEMNVTRNAISILIVYNALEYIEKKELSKYIFWCCIASSFHSAALIFIPIYWCANYWRVSIDKCVYVILGAIICGIICPYITPYLVGIVPSGLETYLAAESENIQSIIVGMLHLCVFIIAYYSVHPKLRGEVLDKYRIGAVMLLVNICFFGLNIGLRYAARMAGLFGPYLIVFVPQIIENITSRNKKNVVTAGIVMLTGAVYIARLFINNIGGTIPYRFFW